jgi:hypothetical protein
MSRAKQLGNLLAVHQVADPNNPDVSHLVQNEGQCPASFLPAAGNFRSRLTFGLAIGQAF